MGRTSRAATAQAHTGTGRPGGTAPAFPLVVALFSTVTALGLFFSTTVPAIAELRHLDRVQHDRVKDQWDLTRALEQDALHRIGLELDPQTVVAELDRRGIFAGALLSNAGQSSPETRARQGIDPGGAAQVAGDRETR
jgi:hypothetical protein